MSAGAGWATGGKRVFQAEEFIRVKAETVILHPETENIVEVKE